MYPNAQENYFDNNLFEGISKSTKVFWAGLNPPLSWFSTTNAILENEKDHRLPNHLHQSFDFVYLLEKNLGEFKNWILITDEALRLLAPGGLLFIRMTDTPLLSIFELKNFINAWGKFLVYFDYSFPDGNRTLAFKNTKTEKRNCELKTFSFGVITNGHKLENLKSFLDSVLKITTDDCDEIEILVCGPKIIENEIKHHSSLIKFIEEPNDFKSIGWITKKKNMIVEASKNQNLIIAHDRYIFPSDFLQNLKSYGPDWSVLVCRQELTDNTRIPDWVTIGSEWGWNTPGILEYGDWSHYNFINGGIIIAKNDILKKSPWNELLFWNQAEDVELTRTLKQNGTVPRLARNLLVFSLPMRKNFMAGFEFLPYIKDKHVIPGSNFINSNHVNPLVEIDKQIDFSQEHQPSLSYQGIFIGKSWLFKTDGIALNPENTGFLSFVLKLKPQIDTNFLFKISHADAIESISINEKKMNFILLTEDTIQIPATLEAINFNNIIRLHLINKKQELTLKSIILKSPEPIIEPKSTKNLVLGSIKKLRKSNRPLIIKTLGIPLLLLLIPTYLTLKFFYKFLRNMKNKVIQKAKTFESRFFHG